MEIRRQRFAVEGSAQAVYHPPQQALADRDVQRSPRGFHGVIRADASEIAQSDGDRLTRLESDHLREQRIPAALHQNGVSDASTR
jgi:hypothetical protein